jgi:hypothetical protein
LSSWLLPYAELKQPGSPGATLPIPFDGKQRQIMVNLDQQAL